VTIAANMRAVLLTGHGGYDRLDFRDDVPLPKPGADDVLIRVAAAGVNNTDINTRIGWYSKSVAEATDAGAVSGIKGAGDDGWSGAAFRFPRIQGADACGHIVAVGHNINPARIGERVLVEPVFHGASRFDILYFGSEVDGGFADYTCVPAMHAHRVESQLSDIELASFPCAYGTAENILTRINVQAGERVLITGASGGVGSPQFNLQNGAAPKSLRWRRIQRPKACARLVRLRLFPAMPTLPPCLGRSILMPPSISSVGRSSARS
jgi:NADPH:quinone reductase-like Zn-dependent oxidoreductase